MTHTPLGPGTSLNKYAPALYFVLGQIGWFACVLGAARDRAWIGAATVVLLVALHLRIVARPLPELRLIASVMLMGGAWDSLLVRAGLMAYPHGTLLPGFAPLWIVALWGLFAAQFNTTYRWLKTRIGIAAALGAVAGPVSFHAGQVLGALRFEKPWGTAVALGVGWAVLLPVVVLLARRWDGVA
jgi:hypothetical protein